MTVQDPVFNLCMTAFLFLCTSQPKMCEGRDIPILPSPSCPVLLFTKRTQLFSATSTYLCSEPSEFLVTVSMEWMYVNVSGFALLYPPCESLPNVSSRLPEKNSNLRWTARKVGRYEKIVLVNSVRTLTCTV